MPQPSISGMDPPFGDAFQNYTFADQALTSTDLLANSSDPDFMYELDRDMTCRQSPKGEALGTVGMECHELVGMEGMEPLPELGEGSELACSSSSFEQWDSYWEDLTKYTRLASCDIWGTKEVDFLGLDDFSSPYQDEEVVSRTPTLAQLNSEDSQPHVSDVLCYPELLLAGPKQPPPPISMPMSTMMLPPPLLSSSSSSGKKAGPLGRPHFPPASSPSCSYSYSLSSAPATACASLSQLPDFAEGSQKATRPVASSTETMAKAGPSKAHGATLDGGGSNIGMGGGSDFVRKAKVRISAGPHPHHHHPHHHHHHHHHFSGKLPQDPEAMSSLQSPSSPCPLMELPKGASSSNANAASAAAAAASASSVSGSQAGPRAGAGGRVAGQTSPSGPAPQIPAMVDRKLASEGSLKRELPAALGEEMGGTSRGPLAAKLHFTAMPGVGGAEGLLPVVAVTTGDVTMAAGGAVALATGEKSKEEEHNYSLFLTRARLAGKALVEEEEEEEEVEEEEEEEDEEEEVGEEEEEEEDEEAGLELDDEDHDEGFGSEHELSDNEEDEEDDDDYEGEDKDDDISDAFSEPGCDVDMGDEVKGLTAGLSRKRGKRRYFWEYSEQLMPSKQERMLKPSEWDRDTLPSNMYQKNGLHQGKYTLKKSRRTDVEDLTPNPRKLLQIGNELRKLNKVISDLTPVSELPLTARPRSRKEKNKLASRACRLKKKAQYEANKVKLWGLGTEYDRLLFVINAIKEEIVKRVQDPSEDKGMSMAEKLDKLIEETLVKSPVAGQTSDFVNQILETTGRGDPTGGLVGLRVPTSKV
ncbi:CREB3 regulatory factor [Engraulis encrasicolus]|uniref:CREB3 regulatory factor n=1 Tax=Engraulis encrasicolus TaxID=184585 RepID=UPI002FD2CD3B